MAGTPDNTPQAPWRQRLHEIIFEADTPAGKVFDVALLIAIVVSTLAVVLESVDAIEERFGRQLRIIEWTVTLLFTVEYVMRLLAVRRPWNYATSFLGIVDLLAVLPTYLSLLFAGTHSLAVIRALRLLRIFRIFKLHRYVGEISSLLNAIRASAAKITVFLLTVMTLSLILGTAMYVIEGPASGFTSIPRGMYWAVVTVTTVGYGDIAPRTIFGQAIAAAAMVIGYSMIIIPTAIFSMELVRADRRDTTTQNCPECLREGHDADATHCKYCGTQL